MEALKKKKTAFSENMALRLAALCFRVKFLEPMLSNVSPQVVPFWGRNDGGWRIFLFSLVVRSSDLALFEVVLNLSCECLRWRREMQWYFEGKNIV